MDPSGKSLQCVVVTPERAVLDEPVDFVALPMYDGELGVLPDRAPLIGRLGFGELRIRRNSETSRFFINGGFAQIRSNIVTVLTSQAIPAEKIDQATAERMLQTSRGPTTTPQAQEDQLKTQERARAQIRVARHVQE